jgi:hypothetical protein
MRNNLERGRDLLARVIDGIGATTERISRWPLYTLPVALIGYLLCVIALVLLTPFIAFYSAWRSE